MFWPPRRLSDEPTEVQTSRLSPTRFRLSASLVIRHAHDGLSSHLFRPQISCPLCRLLSPLTVCRQSCFAVRQLRRSSVSASVIPIDCLSAPLTFRHLRRRLSALIRPVSPPVPLLPGRLFTDNLTCRVKSGVSPGPRSYRRRRD